MLPAAAGAAGARDTLLSEELADYGVDLDAAYAAAMGDPTIDLLIPGEQMDGFTRAQLAHPDRIDGLVVGVVIEDDDVHPGEAADDARAAVEDAPVLLDEIRPCDALDALDALSSGPAVFLICDGPNSWTVGVPAPADASLQDLLDLLAVVPTDAAALGMTTLFDQITPPTVTLDGRVALVDFDETLELADHQMWTGTYVLEQVLTTIWANTDVETVRFTMNGSCEAASHALMATPCADYDRTVGHTTNTFIISEEDDR